MVLALAALFALHQAEGRGMPAPLAALGAIPVTVAWFAAFEAHANPGHANRATSVTVGGVCLAFVAWLAATGLG